MNEMEGSISLWEVFVEIGLAHFLAQKAYFRFQISLTSDTWYRLSVLLYIKANFFVMIIINYDCWLITKVS
jgi:hypothetical protein